MKVISINKCLIALLLVFFYTFVSASSTTCGAGGCVITVDWAIDEEPSSNRHTCDYTQSAIFVPDTTGTGAGKCTFRRALREAGARADNGFCPGCAPILIRFTGLNGSDSNTDDVHFNASTGQWILPIASSGTASFYGLEPQTGINSNGDITISGPVIDVLGGDMPKIMIDSGTTLDLQLKNISIRNMGFMGGQSIHWSQSDGVFENNTWGLAADGMSIEFGDLVGNPDNLAGNHGILTTTNKADNMLVQNNAFAGASTDAIGIHSATIGVKILNNRIGMRIDGTVPIVPAEFKCRTFTSILPVIPALDPSEWFGGEGMSASGTGLLIEGNIIAGLQTIHSTFSTPPGAIQVLGRLHTVQFNTIGKDAAGTQVGVCGQGIQISTSTDNPQHNNGHLILDNEIYQPRNGFDNTKGAILWSDTTVASFFDGGNTIRRNLVVAGTEKYFELSGSLPSALKAFEPAVIDSISGVNISGHSHLSNIFGDPSPCPNCEIDFYLDNSDANQEALEYLGMTIADSNGDFNYTLSAPLANGFGIRTTSTSTANDILPHAWSGQTSEMSLEIYGITANIFKNGFE